MAKRGRPKRVAAAKDEGKASNQRQDVTDAAIMECYSEVEGIDQRIAALNEKKKAALDKFKSAYGISKGAFMRAYKDARLEGAAKTTAFTDYVTCAKAMGVMADLPLGDSVLAKMRAKAEKMQEKEAAEKAAAEEPPVGDGDESAADEVLH